MIPIWREGHEAVLVDQRLLPAAWIDVRITDPAAMAQAIQTLQVRGAPAIGIAGAYGYWLAAERLSADTAEPLARLAEAAALLRAARPTAVNLPWALDRMHARATGLLSSGCSLAELRAGLRTEADAIAADDLAMCKAIGKYGAALIQPGETILTHCNAGGLATGGYGTALGVIRAAHEQGLGIQVFVDETRPVGQGARLTTYELHAAGIPCTLIADNMAASCMAAGRIQRVITGADRIAANGDAVNKIGTYGVAVLAQHHGIPFHIAAPSSTVDLSLAHGGLIPIEERDPVEVTAPYSAPEFFAGIEVFNPAFDLVPHALITSLITEQGVLVPPYDGRLAAHLGAAIAGLGGVD